MSDMFETNATSGREYKVPSITKYTNSSVVYILGKAEEYEREDAKAAAYLKTVAGSE
ncbi:MAG: hypothetical protein FE78DRAFT_26710 [Acidomyces sp. 'richmondensis']|nr:MAG: hypothetical protein FE78DRAFT_26710 [Acidomyces sp. 'richmondensis']